LKDNLSHCERRGSIAAAAPKQIGRVVGGHDRNVLLGVEAAPKRRYLFFWLKKGLRCEASQRAAGSSLMSWGYLKLARTKGSGHEVRDYRGR